MVGLVDKRRRLTPQQERGVLEAHRAWEPDSGVTITDLAEGLGVSRQTLYEVLSRNNEPLKTRPRGDPRNNGEVLPTELLDLMATKAIEVLFDRLQAAEARVFELEAELEARGGSVREH